MMNFPILSSLILLPFIGSLFIFFIRATEKNYTAKYVALFITTANLILSLYLWVIFDNNISAFQFVEEKNWLLGIINYKVGIDGISILFIVLTAFITQICIISCINSVKKKSRCAP